jgi:antitoxin ParD1/3/4
MFAIAVTFKRRFELRSGEGGFMNVSLTPELEQLIHKNVETGLYLSASEVVREALRLLEERDKFQAMTFAEVRKEIQIGIDQADHGMVAPLDVQETLAKVRRRRRSGNEGT